MAADDNKRFVRKQRDHCFAREPLDDNGGVTMWALGGFVPDDPEEAVTFLKTSTPFQPIWIPPKNQRKIEMLIEAENEYRLGLVAKMNAFLNVLDQTNCSVRRACKISGLYRGQADLLRSRCPDFSKRWQEIYEETTDKLEEAGMHRAIYGVKEPIFQQGTQVGHKKAYSDSLLSMMLQGRRTGIYGKKVSTELSGPGGAPISTTATVLNISAEEFKTIAKQIADDV